MAKKSLTIIAYILVAISSSIVTLLIVWACYERQYGNNGDDFSGWDSSIINHSKIPDNDTTTVLRRQLQR